MKFFNLLIAAGVIAILGACQAKPEMKWTAVDRPSFSISIPDGMVAQVNLNEDATLQYADTLNNTYLMVLEESASEFEEAFSDTSLGYEPNFQGYARLIYDDFAETADSSFVAVEPWKNFDAGGYPAQFFQAQANFENVPTFYVFGVAKSDKTYYQILAWTNAEKRTSHTAVLEQAVKSFLPK